MDRVPGSTPATLPQGALDRLAESLRAPGAFAVDAETGGIIAPAGAAAPGPEARSQLLAFAREQRGAAAALLDLSLDGAGAPATPSACRILPLDGVGRVIIVVPIDGGAHAAPAGAERVVAAPSDAAAPAVRILWQCDAEGAITHVGDQLRRLLGDQAGAIAGRRWTDLVGDVLLDPTGGMAKALSRRETASGVELLWSSDGAAGPASLLWSGAPAFDAGRRFRGFRGFLLAPGHLAALAAPAAGPTVAVAADGGAEPADAPTTPDPAAPPTDAAPEAQADGAPHPAADPAAAPLPAMPHLSAAERSAFREIARALGVRGTDDAPASAAPRAVEPAPRPKPDLRLVRTSPSHDDAPPAIAAPSVEASESTAALAPTPEEPTAALTLNPDAAIAPEALAYEVVEPLDDAPTAQPAADEGADAVPSADEPVPAAEPAPTEDDQADAASLRDIAAAIANAVAPPTPAESKMAPGAPAEPLIAPDVAATPEAIEARVAAMAAQIEAAWTAKDEDAAPAPIDSPAAQSVAIQSIPPAPNDPLLPHAREILDRIPVGVLISRGVKVLFANRTLMDLLDYPSLAAIEAHGGVPGLFKGRAPLSHRDGPTGPVLLNSRGGESIAVDARLQGVEWDGEPATLVTFRRAIDVEIGQKLKAAELDLRAREAELRETRAVLDTATDGVAVIDEDGRVMTLNRTAEALFGYEQNEVAGESITTLFAPESHALAADYFEGLKSGGVRSVMNDGRELIGRVRQGGRIPMFVTFGQISDKPVRKFCAVMRDMTAWKKTERDLIDARKAAEEASAQKSDFLAKISHEIRTPLNAIIGFAEVMMEERFGPVGNERYKDYLRDVHASGGHVISLVNDLLDLSKIEAGKLELNFTSVSANEIIRGAVNLMQPQSQRARVVVRSALAGKLPSIVADERALKQIIINLLSNAVKFTDSGGQVIVSSTLTDLGEVAIRIRDTGIGMTEKELAEAMEPFRQLATSRRAGGTGLGLPLTKALVEANRAHLKMSSVKNEGTLVEVVFPPTRVLAE